MKQLFTIIFLLSFSMASIAQVTKDCRPTVDLGVSFQRVEQTKDDRPTDKDSAGGLVCYIKEAADFKLKPLNDDYEVVSFVISASNKSGDIMETTNEGSQIQPRAMMVINFREKQSLVYFDCIKARHKSGVVRTLKPAAIKIEDIQ